MFICWPFHNIFSLPVLAAGFEPSILGLWVECSNTELLLMARKFYNCTHYFFTKFLQVEDDVYWLTFSHFLSPSTRGWIWTLNLRIVSWMFNHCATPDGKTNVILTSRTSLYFFQVDIDVYCLYDFNILSLLVLAAGNEPTALGL